MAQPASAGAGPSVPDVSGATSGASNLAGAVAEMPTPSMGDTINQASVSVEAGYEEEPGDSTALVTQDTTQMPRQANVIDSIPGIFANRNSLSMYEIFRVQSAFPSAAD